jgi:Uma2 family endonuclease
MLDIGERNRSSELCSIREFYILKDCRRAGECEKCADEQKIPDLAPDLAVEVLSEGNTKAEMVRKVREYFEAGVRLVWLTDPKKRTAREFFGS